MSHNTYIGMYLDSKKNFSDTQSFAKSYDLPIERAQSIIDTGRVLYNIPEVERVKISGRY